MIVKHINAKPEDNSLVFLAQSSKGTLLLDYNTEKFIIVDGFTMVTPHKCVYNLEPVHETYSLHSAFYNLYPEELKNE